MEKQKSVGIIEFSHMRGVTTDRVRAAVETGKLKASVKWDKSGRIKIDPELAEKEWPRKIDDPIAGGPTLQKSKSRREEAMARKAEIIADELEGKVVRVEDVRREAYQAAANVKSKLLALPDRLAAELAGEKSQFVMHKRIKEEIELILKSLSEEKYQENDASLL